MIGRTGAIAWILLLSPLPGDEARSPQPPAAGGIEGTVRLEAAAPRRIANRYAAGGTAAREVVAVPAVAYLLGPVGGGATASGPPRLAQRDTTFQPSLLVVPVGGTVQFPNQDKFFHNVFSYSKPKRFDLGRYPQGESKSVTFDEPGVVKVFCEIHKWMRAVVLVVENPHYAVVAEDGSFTMRDVPAGRHRLVVWHADRGEKIVEVDVPPEGATRVDVSL